MAARRPAKISKVKKGQAIKACPSCQRDGKENFMSVMRMVRHSKPSGMFWVCQSCNMEIPTRG